MEFSTVGLGLVDTEEPVKPVVGFVVVAVIELDPLLLVVWVVINAVLGVPAVVDIDPSLLVELIETLVASPDDLDGLNVVDFIPVCTINDNKVLFKHLQSHFNQYYS